MPGKTLTSLLRDDTERDDTERDDTDRLATSVFCDVLKTLSKAPCNQEAIIANFRSAVALSDGFKRLRTEFDGGCGPFPQRLVEIAETYWLELSQSSREVVLLHGDLHHDNIISAARSPWLAVDPKGYVGECAFDAGAFIRNLWRDVRPISNPKRLLNNRVRQIAEELELDVNRIAMWAAAQAILSVWWSYEDGDHDWRSSLDITEWLVEIAREL